MAKALILTDLIKILGLKISTFEREIGISNGTLAKAMGRESDLSSWIIEKIVQKYPVYRRTGSVSV